MKIFLPFWKLLSVKSSDAVFSIRYPSFLPIATLKNVIIVTNPRPPTCISSAITICPKIDQCAHVSTTTSPVTHVAEVAVKRQSKIGVNFPDFDDAGRQSKIVPTAIIIRNPNTSVLAGYSFFAFLKTGILSLFSLRNYWLISAANRPPKPSCTE